MVVGKKQFPKLQISNSLHQI